MYFVFVKIFLLLKFYTNNNIVVVRFKYAPISSVDVERRFSIYKNMLADNRRLFLFENLSKSNCQL